MENEHERKEVHAFQLSKPLSYSKGGDQIDGLFIELRAPTSRHSDECGFLLQAFMRSREDAERAALAAGVTPEAPDQDDETSTPDVKGRDVITLMAIADKVDLPEVLRVARKLFTSGAAYLDGEVKLTSVLLDRISQTDFENMLGDYLVNFTLASLLE